MPVVLASYPNAVASFSEKYDLVDVVFADHINALQREVVAIETALGTLAPGSASTVRDRLAAIESTVANINARFTATHTFPQASVDGLGTDLANLRSQSAAFQATLNQINALVTALQSQKPEQSQVVLLSGEQFVYGLKKFQGLVRLLATQLYSAASTNHAWEIGVSGGRVIKADYTGFGAYDGTGPADMTMQRDGGDVFFGGGIRAAGMAGASVDYAGPVLATETTYTVHAGAPAIALRVPQSGRVVVHLVAEAYVPSGEARMSVQLSGANTAAGRNGRSVVVASPSLVSVQRTIYLAGLNADTTTFTTVFRSTAGVQAYFANVTLAVVPVL